MRDESVILLGDAPALEGDGFWQGSRIRHNRRKGNSLGMITNMLQTN